MYVIILGGNNYEAEEESETFKYWIKNEQWDEILISQFAMTDLEYSQFQIKNTDKDMAILGQHKYLNFPSCIPSPEWNVWHKDHEFGVSQHTWSPESLRKALAFCFKFLFILKVIDLMLPHYISNSCSLS